MEALRAALPQQDEKPGLWQLSACEAVDLLKRREVSPLDLVEASIARIEAVDGLVNALPIRRFEEARRQAAAFSPARHAEAADRPGWLAGLPIAVKDYNDLQGSPTTCGSPIFRDAVAAQSDVTVANLEAHGAIAVAKSNVPEFAGANTFNSVFGATRNPWNPSLTAGGSSGGSAAALAAGMVFLATGNDLGGSLRIPASYCGIVGMRPSVGRVPRPASAMPYDPLWVEGPMGRSVADVALMLDAQAYAAPSDPLSYDRPPVPYATAAATPRRPGRIGFTADLGIGPVDDEVAKICEAAVRRFEGLGTAVEAAGVDFSGGVDAFQGLRAALIAAVRGPLLEQHRRVICDDIIWNIEKGLHQSGTELAQCERTRGAIFQRVGTFFASHDILACPTVAVPPFPVDQRFPKEINGAPLTSYIGWMYLTFVLTLTGCPVLSVPVGFTRDGRPAGLQLMGRPRGDYQVIEAGALLEQMTGLSALVPREPRPLV